MGIPRAFERYSYSEFLSWPEGERWELVDGVAYAMSPAPSRSHQAMAGELHRQFANHLLAGPCRVYVAPVDVKLSTAEADDAPTILQPDLIVCCDPQKLVPEGIAGAPDLVVEVISPASGIADRKWKFELYERFGVPEYWIVDPVARVLEVYQSEEAKRYRRAGAYGPDETVTPVCLPDLRVELSLVFREDEA